MLCYRCVNPCKTGIIHVKGKGKVFPYSLSSVGPGADSNVHALNPQVTLYAIAGGRQPLFTYKFAVTVTKLYYLVTEAYRCEQLAQSCYAALPQ